MKSGIYKITNLVNGKFYIGSSKDINDRWENGHRGNLRRKQHNNPKLQNSWNFYGENNFKLDIIEEIVPDEKLLLEREQYYLDLLKPYDRNIGYNICSQAFGGNNLKYHPRGKEIIQEWKEKYSKLYSGKGNPMFGHKHSNDSIKLQKEKAKGRFTLEWFIDKYGDKEGNIKFEERCQMLRNRKINYSYDNGLKGTKRGPMSEEIKKKISENKLKINLIRKDLHNDILSNKFTIYQLELKYGISKPTILKEKKKCIKI